MPTTTVDEIVTKINKLPKADREELIRRLKEPANEQAESKASGTKGKKKGYVSPDTIWIKENSHRYRGQYVAIKDGKFIASGRTIKEADQAAKAKGVDKPLLHYVFPEGYLPFGGW